METPLDQSTQLPTGKMRWVGFFMFIVGGVLLYFFAVSPLESASHHDGDVSVSLEGVMFAPVLTIIGLILCFLGNDGAGRLFGSRREPKPLGGFIAVALAGIGILLYEWLKSRLRAYGYSI